MAAVHQESLKSTIINMQEQKIKGMSLKEKLA